MKNLIIIILFCITLSSCKKDAFKTGNIYKSAYVFIPDDSDCGFMISIDNNVYYPINLPEDKKRDSGIKEENSILIKYSVLKGDSFTCQSNIFVPSMIEIKKYPKVKIDAILL